jgi:hypothetical protein
VSGLLVFFGIAAMLIIPPRHSGHDLRTWWVDRTVLPAPRVETSGWSFISIATIVVVLNALQATIFTAYTLVSGFPQPTGLELLLIIAGMYGAGAVIGYTTGWKKVMGISAVSALGGEFLALMIYAFVSSH